MGTFYSGTGCGLKVCQIHNEVESDEAIMAVGFKNGEYVDSVRSTQGELESNSVGFQPKRLPERKRKRDPGRRKRMPEADIPLKRFPEFTTGADQEINEALEFNPDYLKMRKQVQTFMDRKKRHRDETRKRFWDEQIIFSQELLVAALLDEFGRARAGPYVVAMRRYWLDHEKMLQGGMYKCAIDCEMFFTYFDIERHGLIMFEEFVIILDIIDPELAQRDDVVHIIFMFLDQTDRNSFNVYDLECFMSKTWGGDVGRFQQKVKDYMRKPLPIPNDELHLHIREKVAKNREHIPIDFDAMSFAEMEHYGAVDVGNLFSSQTSDFDDSSTQDLINKMKQLRADMEAKNMSSAFINISDSPAVSRPRIDSRTSASWVGLRSTSVRSYFQNINYFSDKESIREHSVSRTLADMFDDDDSDELHNFENESSILDTSE